MDEQVFRSKIDLGLLLVLLLAVVLPVAIALSVRSGQKLGAGPWVFVALVLAPAVFLPPWLLLTTGYRLDATTLHIRSGPFAWRVPLAELRSIEPTRSALSGPALSLDRLRVRFGRDGEILISPADRQRFLDTLRARAPQARIGPE